MSDDLMLDVGEAHKLKLALIRAGFKNENLHRLFDDGFLTDLYDVVRGRAEIRPVVHLINGNARPLTPAGWYLEEHRRNGIIQFDPAKLELFLDPSQKGGRQTDGRSLRRALATKSVLNANDLDHLLDHSYVLSREWKKKKIFFWGTIYRDAGGHLYVRYLEWVCKEKWHWGAQELTSAWDENCPAVLFKQ